MIDSSKASCKRTINMARRTKYFGVFALKQLARHATYRGGAGDWTTRVACRCAGGTPTCHDVKKSGRQGCWLRYRKGGAVSLRSPGLTIRKCT